MTLLVSLTQTEFYFEHVVFLTVTYKQSQMYVLLYFVI